MNKVTIGMFSLLFAVASQAATLITWENDALEGNEASTEASRVNPGLKAKPVLERGSGLAPAAYKNAFAARNADQTSLDDAVFEDCYVTWTMEATDGSQMNLSGLNVILSAQDASDYKVQFVLFSDKTGFVPGNELATFTAGGTGDAGDGLGVKGSANLNSIEALQGVGAVEFRLYIFGQSGPYTQVGIGRGWNQDGAADLKITGTVEPIPAAAPAAEPTPAVEPAPAS